MASLQDFGTEQAELGITQAVSQEAQSARASKPARAAACRPITAVSAGVALVCMAAVGVWTLRPLWPQKLPGDSSSLENKQADTAESFSDWYQNSSWFESYSVDPARVRLWRRQTTDQDTDAICNDGTPGAFYVRPGQGQGSRRQDLILFSMCTPPTDGLWGK